VSQNKSSTQSVIDYWNKRPCNINHSPLPVGTVEYFNEVEVRKYFVEPHIPEFANFTAWKDKRVLEIGLGIGTDAVNFMRNGADYTGIEISDESLNIAVKRFECFGLNGHFYLGNVENLLNLNLQGTFDLVYSFGVLHHTPSIEKSIEQIRNLCGPESTFKFMVYAKNSWKNALIEAGLEQPEAQSGCPIANTYTKNEISDICRRNGFEVKKIVQAHIFPYEIAPYKNYEYKKLPWFETMPDDVFEALENSLGWHLLVDCTPI
jgi:SAM-dependent methyltransferase